MSRKHIIQYSSKRPTRMNYCNFGNYKDKTGKNRVYVDINGLEQESGFTTTQPTIRLDLTLEHEKLVDDFLVDHPLVNSSKWSRTDMLVEEQTETNTILTQAEAVNLASKLNIAETRDMAMLLKLNLNFDDTVLKAKLINQANQSPDNFLEAYHDQDRSHKIFIKKALEKGLIRYENNTFRYGGEAVGTNEQRVIEWLLDNKDVYAVLKLEVSGQTIKKTVNKKIKKEQV